MTETSIQSCFAAVMSALGTMPDDVRAATINHLSYPVVIESFVMTGEYLYAVRDRLDKPASAAAAAMVAHRNEMGFWGIREDGRGHKMVAALAAGKVKEGDPAPLPQFAAATVDVLTEGAPIEAALR